MANFRFYKGDTNPAGGIKNSFRGDSSGPAPLSSSTITKEITLSWETLASANNSVTLEWQTFIEIDNDVEFEWLNGVTRISKEFTSIWQVTGIIYRQLDLFYKTLGDPVKPRYFRTDSWYGEGFKFFHRGNSCGAGPLPVTNKVTLSWDTGLIGRSPDLSWKMGGITRRLFTFPWKTGGKPQKVQEFRWPTNGRIDMAFGLNAYKFDRIRVPNNVNYSKYRTITVDNTLNANPLLADTTVEVEFDHAAMVTAGESDEFGKQLRLTYRPGNVSEREIDAEIINPNTSTAKLRFKLYRTIAPAQFVQSYYLYTGLVDERVYEETFRDPAGIYWFIANKLSTQLALTGSTFVNTPTGFKRTGSGDATIGFNVPDDADVEIDFRFLDAGANNQSRFIGIDWRGDNSNNDTTFRLDNDNGVTDNRINNYFDGSNWNALGSAVLNAKTETHTMRVLVEGSDVDLYLDGVLLDSVADSTPSIGGMLIKLPSNSSVEITAIRVKRVGPIPTLTLGTATENLVRVPANTKVLIDSGTTQRIQSTILRLKRQPDGLYILETHRNIGPAGDSIPATVDQDGSVELHIWDINGRKHASIERLDT